MTEPTYFATPDEWRAWLAEHHASAQELWVGFYKVGSGQPSITWPQSVDEALCYGWIDGIRKTVDDTSYKIRFTPRKARSIWSAVNIKRVEELTAEGRMQPPGLAAFAKLTEDRSGVYAYEQSKHPTFNAAQEAQFRANEQAWTYFQAQAAGYRRLATWWVVSAKREDTQQKRLATLIEDSANGRTIAQFSRPPRRG